MRADLGLLAFAAFPWGLAMSGQDWACGTASVSADSLPRDPEIIPIAGSRDVLDERSP